MVQHDEDKAICLEIIRAGMRLPNHPKAFQGPAANWEKWDDPSFQAFAETNGIGEDTIIAAYDIGGDTFSISIF